MHRKSVAVVALMWAGSGLAVAACSFPDIAFAPESTSGGGGSSGNAARDGSADVSSSPTSSATTSGGPQLDDDDSSDSGSPNDSGPDTGGEPSDSGNDSGSDAGHDAGGDNGVEAGTDSGVDAGHDSGADAGADAGHDSGTPVCCDCDGDLHYDTTKPSCAGMTPVDCDDTDGRVNKDKTFSSADPVAPWNGDWNCDHSVTKLVKENVACSALDLSALGTAGCAGTYGFNATVVCGQLGHFIQCKNNALNLGCVEDTTKANDTTRQQCE